VKFAGGVAVATPGNSSTPQLAYRSRDDKANQEYRRDCEGNPEQRFVAKVTRWVVMDLKGLEPSPKKHDGADNQGHHCAGSALYSIDLSPMCIVCHHTLSIDWSF
jgi:hypothetical protein